MTASELLTLDELVAKLPQGFRLQVNLAGLDRLMADNARKAYALVTQKAAAWGVSWAEAASRLVLEALEERRADRARLLDAALARANADAARQPET